MGSLLVAMVDVDAEDVLELAAAEDQQPVEAFATYGADPALDVHVRVRRLDGRTDDLDSIARKESVECRRELRVAIIDQEPHWPVTVVAFHQEVARLLQHPRRVRSTGAGEVLDPPIPDRDEGEQVNAAQPNRFDREEVTRQDRLAMGA